MEHKFVLCIFSHTLLVTLFEDSHIKYMYEASFQITIIVLKYRITL